MSCGSPTSAAIALAVPPLTMGLVAGTYEDRWDRRRIMLVSDSLRAIVVLASMLFAGVFGDLLGVRTVFLLAGAIVIAGGLVAFVLYRGIALDEQTTLPDRPGTTAERASV